MQEIISWYMEHKTYGNILIIGIIGLMLYNIGYGVGTAIYASNFMFDVITIKG